LISQKFSYARDKDGEKRTHNFNAEALLDKQSVGKITVDTSMIPKKSFMNMVKVINGKGKPIYTGLT